MPAADEFLRSVRPMQSDTAAVPAFEDLQEAAEWFAVLQAGAVSDADRSRWQSWRFPP